MNGIKDEPGFLVVTLDDGGSVTIGAASVVATIDRKGKIKLAIRAPQSVHVTRGDAVRRTPRNDGRTLARRIGGAS